MKLTKPFQLVLPLFVALIAVILVSEGFAAPRHRPGNPRGVLDPRGALDPRGPLDPRGVLDPRGPLDPRGVFDPRGPFDPRNPHRYMYGLPGGYAIRRYGSVNFYYCSGSYYYPYIINGQTVYTITVVRNGVPVVPARPY
jgi:hypothetical protein